MSSPFFNTANLDEGNEKMTTVEELLKEWNNGILRGAKARLAKEIKLPDTNISSWISGRTRPGESAISKMSKIFKKSEEDIKAAFGVKYRYAVSQHAGYNNRGVSQTVNHADIEFFRAELKMIEAKMDTLKTLEFKIDLLLERKGK
jgi:hypothetical protein